MKIKYVLPLSLLLVGCSFLEGKGYDFAYKAMDELVNQVEDISTVEIRNALYHPYDEESELKELVVFYYYYDEDGIEDLDAYGMYSYDATTLEYKFTSGDVAEKYFYFAVGMDNESYESLDAYLLNKYIEKEIVKK